MKHLRRPVRGFATAAAMASILVSILLIAAVMVVSSTQMNLTTRSVSRTRATLLAEAGIEHALVTLTNSWSATSGSGSLFEDPETRAVPAGSFSYTIQALSSTQRLVTSTGTDPTGRTAVVVATIESNTVSSGSSTEGTGFVGLSSFNIQNNSSVLGYDSTNSPTVGSVKVLGQTNNVTNFNNSRFDGEIRYRGSVSINSNLTPAPTMTKVSTLLRFPPIPATPGSAVTLTGTMDANYNGPSGTSQTFTGSRYYASNFSVPSGKTVIFTQPVEIWVPSGNVQISGNIVTHDNKPANLRIYNGSGGINISGNGQGNDTPLYLSVYSPSVPLNINNRSSVYGTFVMGQASLSGAQVIIDRAGYDARPYTDLINPAAYAILTGGTVTLSGTPDIRTTPANQHTAHVHSNTSIVMNGTPSVDGRLSSVGAITGTGYHPNVTPAAEVALPSEATLTTLEADWKAQAQTGTTVNAATFLSGAQANVTLNTPCYINGSFSMNAQQRLTINGSGVCYVDGSVSLSGQAVITNGAFLVVKSGISQTGGSGYVAATNYSGYRPTVVCLNNDFQFGGNGSHVGVVYAARGNLRTHGNASFTGSLIASGTLSAVGTYQHYYPTGAEGYIAFPSLTGGSVGSTTTALSVSKIVEP